MSNPNNRVLGRIGARDLAPEEIESVSGGTFHTNVCTAIRSTVSGDGDACLDRDVY
ncbi:MAG TPA: hypothetical protein VG759_09555 [Candidatus Angelobacter sp.]|jgi:hypothetical protein|nr:hypothetical protein [Candidatus Angelobacter sp.]